jgi:hypothetical protein
MSSELHRGGIDEVARRAIGSVTAPERDKDVRLLTVVRKLPKIDEGQPAEFAAESRAFETIFRVAHQGFFDDAKELVKRLGGGTSWVARQLLSAAEGILLSHQEPILLRLAELGMAAASLAEDQEAYCRHLLAFAEAKRRREEWNGASEAWNLALSTLDPARFEERSICHVNLATAAQLQSNWPLASRHFMHFLVIDAPHLNEDVREEVLRQLAKCYLQMDEPIGALLVFCRRFRLPYHLTGKVSHVLVP